MIAGTNHADGRSDDGHPSSLPRPSPLPPTGDPGSTPEPRPSTTGRLTAMASVFSHVSASVVSVPLSPDWAMPSSSSAPLRRRPAVNASNDFELEDGNANEHEDVLASYFDQASTVAPTVAAFPSVSLTSVNASHSSHHFPPRTRTASQPPTAPFIPAMPPPSTVPSRNGRLPSQPPPATSGTVTSRGPSLSRTRSRSRPSTSARSTISSASLGILAPGLAHLYTPSQVLSSSSSSSRKRTADRAALCSSPAPPPFRPGGQRRALLTSQHVGVDDEPVSMSTPRPPTTRASNRPATRARSVVTTTGQGGNASEAEPRFLVALFSPKGVTGVSSGGDGIGAPSGGHGGGGGGGGGPSGEIGICVFDLVTTTCLVSQFLDSKSLVRTLNKLNVYPPSHLIVPSTFYKPDKSEIAILLESNLDGAVEIIPISRKHFSAINGLEYIRQYALEDQVQHLETGLAPDTLALSAIAAMLKFIETDRHLTFTRSGVHFIHEAVSGTMFIDTITARNLELVRNQTGVHAHTLLGVLNKCQTVMGTRLLRSTILQPPAVPDTIELRLNAVADLVALPSSVQSLLEALKQVPNIDKLVSGFIHIHHKSTTVKSSELDLALILDLRTALTTFPSLVTSLAPFTNPLLAQAHTILSDPALDAMLVLINELFAQDLMLSHTPIGQRNQRAFAIKSGVHGLLDVSRRTYQEAVADVMQLVDDYSARYAVPFRAVYQAASHGFVLECKVDQIPPEVLEENNQDGGGLPEVFVNVAWKGKVVVCTTLDVMKLNERIQESMNEIFLISDRIVMDLKEELRSKIGVLYKVSESIALVDLLCCFTRLSLSGTYVRPILSQGMTVIAQGRHPILSMLVDRRSRGSHTSSKRAHQASIHAPAPSYVPNDTYLDFGCNVQVITGANGAGKTCYLKQVALITIMAHMGCPVPAQEAVVCLTEVMLSRMSFDDSLLTNASTFTLEMREVAHILRELAEVSWVDNQEAPEKMSSLADDGSVVIVESRGSEGELAPIQRRALVLMDEIGRGTSPSEAVGIAYAIVEALAHTKAFVLFATHFHQLFSYLEHYPNIVHLHLSMHISTPSSTAGTTLTYDYRVQDGPSPTTRGYGIQLASSVQLPTPILATATRVADQVAHIHGLVSSSEPDPKYAFHRAVHESARRVVAIKYNPHLDEDDRARCLRELQAELRPSFPGLQLQRERSRSVGSRSQPLSSVGGKAEDVDWDHLDVDMDGGVDMCYEYETPVSQGNPPSSCMNAGEDLLPAHNGIAVRSNTETASIVMHHSSPPTPHQPTERPAGPSASSTYVHSGPSWPPGGSVPTSMRLTDSIGKYDPVSETFVPPRPNQFGGAADSVVSFGSVGDVTDPIED